MQPRTMADLRMPKRLRDALPEVLEELRPEPLTARRILADPCASYALKGWIRAALERDPVDALADAETLAEVLRAELERIQGAR